MHLLGRRLVYSATDLSGFLACPHRTVLDRRAALGGPKPRTFDDPGLEALRQRGLLHEEGYLEALGQGGRRNIVAVEAPDPDLSLSERWEKLAADTVDAMRAGADVIYQGALFDGTWIGRPDFLLRVETPSDLGPWSYEPIDAKLARHARGGALLQVLLYAELLAAAQGRGPESVHLALGGPAPRTETFRVADYAAYFRFVRNRFLRNVETAPAEPAGAPEPVEHCGVCAWHGECDAERRRVDHLSFVAGISGAQRRALNEAGITTLTGLARMPLDPLPKLDGVSAPALVRIREQARIQLEGQIYRTPVHELLTPVVPGQGLAALPAPSPGDLFFDLESNRFAFTHGLQYLFGFADVEGNYTAWWALDPDEERRVFEGFVDFVMDRLERYPDLHVYHFAPYETTALKQLMGRFASREDEVDRLLRGGVFVDLHRVVRQGLRASVESYSIKKLEAFYGYQRDVPLIEATHALASFEAWLELGPRDDDVSTLRRAIEGYNRDDCLSTLRLRDWLESQREELARATGEAVPRPAVEDGEPSEALSERRQEIAELASRLAGGVPADPAERSPEQHARWLLAHLLDFHRREEKSLWWEYFHYLGMSDDEFLEDDAALGGLEYAGVVGEVKRSYIHRYRFPRQEHRIGVGSAVIDPATGKAPGTVVAVDEAAGTIDLRRGKNSSVLHPRSIFPHERVSPQELQDSIQRTTRAVADQGFADTPELRVVGDLLLRRPPRAGQRPGAPVAREGESVLDAACRLVVDNEPSLLAIQGPPGAGKTYTGARMIVAALRAGRRVGVTGPSHKVIANLLAEICRAADQERLQIRAIQKATEEQAHDDPRIERTEDNARVARALASGEATLAAGTAWLWAREVMAQSVDLLFVDEAGQFSLANTLAVAQAAPNLVLLGDPRQLEQPQQGAHPPDVGVSALDHILGGHATLPPNMGLFLHETWRLHPSICSYSSEIFYDGRLRPTAGLERQLVRGRMGQHRLEGTGLRLIPVPHTGNQNESPEEVAAVVALVREILDAGATWIDREGEERPIGLEDILIVAPYNAQVSALAAALPAGARVGTVDRFQGQEAPIVLYSMATSSAELAPRGMNFLYSGNRLNVATSRARCVAAIVASPDIFAPECRTPEQMRLANAFCRFLELAIE